MAEILDDKPLEKDHVISMFDLLPLLEIDEKTGEFKAKDGVELTKEQLEILERSNQ